MPGIVVFRRRWSVGSDDFVVAAVFLVILHAIWIVTLGVILGVVEFGEDVWCTTNLWWHVVGYLVILGVCVLIEAIIAWISMRGTILEPKPRASMQYLLYTRLGILFVELSWLILGIVWVSQKYSVCRGTAPMKAIIGIIVCNWAVMLSVLVSICCTFDTAGRSWVKMKRYQASVKERETRPGHKRRSGSRRRNWRHSAGDYFRQWSMHGQNIRLKAMRAYEQSWDRRCAILFCCVKEEHNRNSFTEIAKLFTEFFRELDVVPTDIVAGLVLLRQHQKMRRKFVVAQPNNDVYQFLSGVPVTPQSRFLSLTSPDTLADYRKVLHYMRYALAAYGWPMYMMMETGTGLCQIMPHLRCCCCCCQGNQMLEIVEDNCCECNFAALRKLSGLKRVDVIYATYHVNIGETPFFVAVDHDQKTVVISIRGTLSLQDVLTDLKADCEPLPTEPQREDWQGHKGMVQAAVYIKKKLKDESLLAKAFGSDLDVGTQEYELVLVGHSLGAGTAAILAILLRQEYPSLHCYSYSPPGGLLSASCVEDTKSFITSVIVGKDVVPRIGLHQLEALRNDLINVIKKSKDPKWKIIAGSVLCCGCAGSGDGEGSSSQQEMYELMKQEKENRYFLHPSDDQIALTTHTPLFPPGRIIHIVRNHPNTSKSLFSKEEPVYQAIWADNQDFDEVLISPTMINDHMPDNVMDALEKVVTNVSPAKPVRQCVEKVKKTMVTQNTLLSADPASHFHDHSHQHPLLVNNSSPLHAPDSVPHPDYAEVQRRAVPGRSRMVAPLATLVAQSYPPNSLTADPLQQRPARLDVVRDDMYGMAPLASPETLSDASSMDSVGSKRYSNGYQKLTSSIYKMAPIAQSPLRPTRSDGFGQFQEQPSPCEHMDKYFPASSPGCLPPSCHLIHVSEGAVEVKDKSGNSDKPVSPDSQLNSLTRDSQLDSLTRDSQLDSLARDSQLDSLARDSQIDSLARDSQLDSPTRDSQAAIIPPAFLPSLTPIQTPQLDLENSSMVNLFDLYSLSSAVVETDEFQLDVLEQSNCGEEVCMTVDADSAIDEQDVETGSQESVAESNSDKPYPVVFENKSFSPDDEDGYILHSPDSCEVSAGVLLYHPVQGHYSPAGRGYPHGYYVTPLSQAPLPDLTHNTTNLTSDIDNHLVSTIDGKSDPIAMEMTGCDVSMFENNPHLTEVKSSPVSPVKDSLPCSKMLPPEICIDLCDPNTPSSEGSQDDLLPVNIIEEFQDISTEKYNAPTIYNSRASTQSSSTSSSETDSEDFEHMSDTPIQILTNEAYL